jgi:hypothetical protein
MWWEAAHELLKDSCEECGGQPAEEEPDLIPQSPRHTQRVHIHFSTQNSIRSARAGRHLAHAWIMIMIVLPSFLLSSFTWPFTAHSDGRNFEHFWNLWWRWCNGQWHLSFFRWDSSSENPIYAVVTGIPSRKKGREFQASWEFRVKKGREFRASWEFWEKAVEYSKQVSWKFRVNNCIVDGGLPWWNGLTPRNGDLCKAPAAAVAAAFPSVPERRWIF